MSKFTAQQINDLFDDAKFNLDEADDVYMALFGMVIDHNDALMFLGAIRAKFGEAAPDCLYPLMGCAFRRTDAYFKALDAHVKQLLPPKRRKGGDA